MSKAKTTTPISARGASDERAYGRVALSDLSDARVAQWSVRAVAGERRHFARRGDAASAAAASSVARIALQAPALHDGTQKLVGLRCGACEIAAFESLAAQHAHFKTDWHCLNLKRRGKGLAPVASEADAAPLLKRKKGARRTGDADNSPGGNDDGYGSSSSSSSSGASELDDDDDVYTTTEPVVEFSDGKSVFKVFKNVLPLVDSEDFDPYAALDAARASGFRWAVFLLRSGRFAGAVFDRDTAVCHKTFQRYTVRRKQGGSQAASDASGGKAKSAGATLRRYNEAALKQDVADLLVQWKDALASAELIFLSSGKTDRATFFGGKTPALQPDDARLRRIPFATFRPTFEELCRVRAELISVRFAPLPAPAEEKAKRADAKAAASSKSRVAEAAQELGAVDTEGDVNEPVEVEAEVLPPVIQLVVDGDLTKLRALNLADVDVDAVDATNLMSALHHASARDAAAMVSYLLGAGANPSLLDVRGRPPYFLCSAKETRNAFRRFVAEHPDAWDYAASQIPTALTTEMEQKKKEKEAEKRRRAKERKKQQKAEAAEAALREAAREEEAARQAAAGRACDACGRFAGKAPLHRLEYKYCSSECVASHKRQLMSEAALRRFGS
ncbi:hypothetical protein PybrP1_011535 [[Pythium] brassicae (nom. inval.)]|nr:hypothetical protein PybrP1_011535 [[Pythium] brassicae (nom. inval.)]